MSKKLEEILREYNKKQHNNKDLWCIVTGANSGIGFETSRVLAELGFNIIMACRSQTRGMEAIKKLNQKLSNVEKRGILEFQQCDLNSIESIINFTKRLKEKDRKYYLLIQNAGVMAVPFTKTLDNFETHFQVNYLSQTILGLLMLDELKKTKGRIISVGSEAHQFTREISFDEFDQKLEESMYDRFTSYSLSKTILIMFVKEFAKRCKDVTWNVCHPGVVATSLGEDLFFPLNYAFTFATSLAARSSLEGAVNSIYLSISDEVKDVSGEYFHNCHTMAPNKLVNDEKLREKVFKKTLEIIEKYIKVPF